MIPPQTSPNAPQPALGHFVAYALHRTKLPHFVTLVGLILLQRLKARYPSARGSSGHRLFISAFMIASKVVCDDTYSNQSWCIVAQKMFSLKEMNQMEREMCGYLEWNLNASTSEVDAFEAKIKAEHSTLAHNARKASLKAQQQAQLEAQQRAASPQVRPSSATSDRVTAALPQRSPYVKAQAARTPAAISTLTNPTAALPLPSASASSSSSTKRVSTPASLSASSTPSSALGHNIIPSSASVPTQLTSLASSMSYANEHRPYPSQRYRTEVPPFHPGSNGQSSSQPSSSHASSRRGSRTTCPATSVASSSRPSGSYGMNATNHYAQRDSYPEDAARTGSMSGTHTQHYSGRHFGNGEYDDEYMGTTVSPGTSSSIKHDSATWSAPKSSYLTSSSQRHHTSTTNSPSHLHSSPYPSLTNDSNQSSPDSQLCQTPSPVAASRSHYHNYRGDNHQSSVPLTKPVPIHGVPSYHSNAIQW